jgi:hypothetical protein
MPRKGTQVVHIIFLGGAEIITLTIYVSVVFMARYIMNFRRVMSLRGTLEGVGPKNRDH